MQRRQLATAEQNLIATQKTLISDEADLAQKRIDLERNEALWKRGFVSSAVRDQSATALKQTAAVLERDRALKGAAEKNIDLAKANIHNAEEALRLARIVLGYTTLRAPFDGVILVRQAELGEVVVPGTPIVTLADLDHVWLRAYVNETDIGKVRHGQDAVVTTDTYPGQEIPGPHLVHRVERGVHAEDRRDPCRARDAGLPDPHRHRQPDPRAGPRNAGGRTDRAGPARLMSAAPGDIVVSVEALTKRFAGALARRPGSSFGVEARRDLRAGRAPTAPARRPRCACSPASCGRTRAASSSTASTWSADPGAGEAARQLHAAALRPVRGSHRRREHPLLRGHVRDAAPAARGARGAPARRLGHERLPATASRASSPAA